RLRTRLPVDPSRTAPDLGRAAVELHDGVARTAVADAMKAAMDANHLGRDQLRLEGVEEVAHRAEVLRTGLVGNEGIDAFAEQAALKVQVDVRATLGRAPKVGLIDGTHSVGDLGYVAQAPEHIGVGCDGLRQAATGDETPVAP